MSRGRNTRPSYTQGYARYSYQVAPEVRSIRESLVGLWHPSLGITGGMVEDVSRHGRKGTFNGTGTHWADNAATFNGSDDYLDFGADPTGGLNQVSVIARFRRTDINSTNFGGAFASGSDLSCLMFCASGTAGPATFRVRAGSTNADAQCGYAQCPIRDGNWHTLVGTYDGVTVRLYGDGQIGSITAAQTGAVDATSATWKFGQYAAGTFMNGSMSMCAVANRALTPNEIRLISSDPDILVRRYDPAVSAGARSVGRLFKETELGKQLFNGLIA